MIADRKKACRAEGLAARGRAPGHAQETLAGHLSAVLAGHRGVPVAGYMAMRGEADPLAAMEEASAHGPVGMPVVGRKGAPLQFRLWEPGTLMTEGAFGALIPKQGDWMEPEILVVPLVAFDARGGRLGYGGGFYDRTLERLRGKGPVLAVGLAFAAQEVAEVPLEPVDQRLDMIVTEEGVRSFPPAN